MDKIPLATPSVRSENVVFSLFEVHQVRYKRQFGLRSDPSEKNVRGKSAGSFLEQRLVIEPITIICFTGSTGWLTRCDLQSLTVDLKHSLLRSIHESYSPFAVLTITLPACTRTR